MLQKALITLIAAIALSAMALASDAKRTPETQQRPEAQSRVIQEIEFMHSCLLLGQTRQIAVAASVASNLSLMRCLSKNSETYPNPTSSDYKAGF